MWNTIFFVITCVLVVNSLKLEQVLKKRDAILKEEYLSNLGGKLKLSKNEKKLNECLMKLKHEELDYAYDNPQYFNFTHHYFKYKNQMKDSKVYKILRELPKGAILHLHDRSILGADYLMQLTYLDKLYICFDSKEMLLRFSEKTPEIKCSDEWKLLSEVREKVDNVETFDLELRKHFTMEVEDPDKTYPTIKESWSKFMKYLNLVSQLVSYRPIWEQYFYESLKHFREQHTMYAEVRTVLPRLYELNGTEHDEFFAAKCYESAIRKFVDDHPDYIGAKIILSPFRTMSSKELEENLALAKKLKKEIPNYFAGFDIVGQEDLGKPLKTFLPQLVSASDEIDYYFHAGETSWYGHTDENLIDAILLKTKRLGHAFALHKHPALMKEVIKNDICVEVNIISNTVLSLVRDVRNHPLSVFISQNVPIVLSSDDSGAWDGEGITEDFYVAFVGVANRQADLKFIKSLALNSLLYSDMSKEDKARALNQFNRQWNDYVDNFDCSLY